MMISRMFPFITCTWNPLCGRCQHECDYCWARELAQTRKLVKYLEDVPEVRGARAQLPYGRFMFLSARQEGPSVRLGQTEDHP